MFLPLSLDASSHATVGMDLAYESAKAGAKEVVLCTRGGFLSFPKALVSSQPLLNLPSLRFDQNDFEMFGFRFDSEKKVPIDSLITNLAETAYVVCAFFVSIASFDANICVAPVGSCLSYSLVVSIWII